MGISSKYISDADWEAYKNTIKSFLDVDAGRQQIHWLKHINQLNPYGEDLGDKYFDIELDGLCFYNAFRNWPLNKATSSGELDEENLTIYISKDQIESKGYLSEDGYWKFNWSEDRFIINGIGYKPSGDTQVAQAKDEALIFLVILKRDRDYMLNLSDSNILKIEDDGIHK